MKERLDKVLKARRIIRSRSKAQRMIAAGRVKVDGRILTRPGHAIDSEAEIEILSFDRYVSRAGDKLEAALDEFRIDPSGLVCLDVGASTGGFTDCLLQHGAKRVHAVDVGHGQIHPKLRENERVMVHEGLNARFLEPKDIGEQAELVTIDVSFISLELILPPLTEILEAKGQIIALLKPQFEVGRENLPSDGVVKDPAARQKAFENLEAFVRTNTPWQVRDKIYSPVIGERGNLEILLRIQ
ncbi:TlyA family RNA methyltransferase [Candidatus Bipolaricaulota bacterium]|nr:TlyA family RNA methyltransferase [Candidatus Bipolaricaulota bacterium]